MEAGPNRRNRTLSFVKTDLYSIPFQAYNHLNKSNSETDVVDQNAGNNKIMIGDEIRNCAYEVRVHPYIRIVSALVCAIAVFCDIIGAWGIIRNWETHPRPVGEIILVALVFNVPALLVAFFIEYYVYRVRLFVITKERKYAYRPLFGRLKRFTIYDISRVDMGGGFLSTLWRGHVLSIYGNEKNAWCRLDLRMINAVRLSDELKKALHGRPFEAHYTEQQLNHMRHTGQIESTWYMNAQNDRDEF